MAAMASTRVTAKAIREVVDELHRIRISRDLTYDDLAEELGLSRRNVVRFMTERGAGVQERTLYKIRQYLIAQEAAREERASA